MFFEIILCAILFTFLYQRVAKPFNLPAGTFGLPLIGYLPPLKGSLTQHFQDLKQEYGDIFTTKWGVHRVIVLTTYDLVKKAFGCQDFSGRMPAYSSQMMSNSRNGGITLAEEDIWHANRKFATEYLCDKTSGKTALVTSIEEEAASLIQFLEEKVDRSPESVDMNIFDTHIYNVILQMLTGKRYGLDDQKLVKLISNNKADKQILQGCIFFFDVMPFLRNIVPTFVYDKITGAGELAKHQREFQQSFMEDVKEHEKNLNPESPKDFIDQYLVEMKENSAHRNYDDLILNMSDMISAGADTTANTLRWVFYYSALYPEIQSKIQGILDENVPRSRLPSMEDRSKLQYIDAFILEVARCSSLYPVGVIHTVSTYATFDGFHLAKGIVAVAALELIHRDPKSWKKPDEFYPEHFLKEDGNVDTQKEGFLAFSLGQRKCVGESLALQQLFLFTTAILQRFSVGAPAGVTLDASSASEKERFCNPLKYNQLVFKRRH